MTQRWLLALGLAVSIPLCFTPVSNPDVPWHLSAARWMVEHHALPRADFLSWTRPGAPWIDFEWGTQLLYHGLDALGGVTALWLFKSLVFTALLAVFAALMALWELPAVWTALAALPLTLALIPNLDLRPENLTLLFCILQLYLLEWYRLKGKGDADFADCADSSEPNLRNLRNLRRSLAFFQFGLYAVWANMHGGFVMGLLLGGLYIAGEASALLMPRVQDPKAPVDLRPLKPWLMLGLASFLGTLVNPFGVKVYEVAFSHASQLKLLSQHIQEWQAPSMFHMSLWPYWAMVLFSFPVFAWNYAATRKTPFAHIYALLVFGLSSSAYTRNTAFFCIWVYPLTLLSLSELQPPPAWVRVRGFALGLGFVFLLAAAYTVMPPPGTFRIIHDDIHEPAGAAAYLSREKAVLGPLHLFNPWEWGGYIGYTLYPDYKVFMDGRYLFHEYLPLYSAALQTPDSWNQFLSGQDVDVVVFHNWRQWRPDPDESGSEPVLRPITRWFFPRTRWAMVYWDAKAVILVRRDQVPKAWLDRSEYRFLFPKDPQWIRLQVLRGKFKLADVEREARRYLSEIGDRENSAKLYNWLRLLQKEMSTHRP